MWMPLDNDCDIVADEHNNCAEDYMSEQVILSREGVRESLNYHVEDITMDDDIVDDVYDCDYEPVDMHCSCRSFWNSRYGRVVVYIFLSLLVLASLTSFIVVIQLMVIPYSRVTLFRRTNCTVLGVSQLLIESHCTCSSSKGCDGSQYMCLTIHVQFNDDRGYQHNASISDNEVLLGKNVRIV